MAAIIRERLEQEIDGVPIKQLVADMMIMLALGALDPAVRIRACTTLIDYTDGKPPIQIANPEGPDGNAIPLIIRGG